MGSARVSCCAGREKTAAFTGVPVFVAINASVCARCHCPVWLAIGVVLPSPLT
jgi:hypothetical protein